MTRLPIFSCCGYNATMNPLCDYHMHTPLSGHAGGAPSEFVERAISLGLEEIGFSDHAPLLSHDDPSITMSRAQVPEYHRMIEEVRARFTGKTRVRIALEADYLPGYEKQTRAVVEAYPYDYIIGSVHFIGDWAFDDPNATEKWNGVDVEKTYRDYYSLLRKSAESGLFQIMGHVDLPKKFGHRPKTDLTMEIRRTAEAFQKSGVVVEINTAGLRKPVQEIYPSLEALKIYGEAGVPITFGSDAHAPQEVAAGFEAGADLARQAGYKEYVLFKHKKIVGAASL